MGLSQAHKWGLPLYYVYAGGTSTIPHLVHSDLNEMQSLPSRTPHEPDFGGQFCLMGHI